MTHARQALLPPPSTMPRGHGCCRCCRRHQGMFQVCRCPQACPHSTPPGRRTRAPRSATEESEAYIVKRARDLFTACPSIRGGGGGGGGSTRGNPGGCLGTNRSLLLVLCCSVPCCAVLQWSPVFCSHAPSSPTPLPRLIAGCFCW